MTKRIEELPDGRVSFIARIVTRSGRSEVAGWDENGRLKIRLAAAPVDDAANRELIKLLSGLLELRKSEVVIASGAHSRTKRLTVPAAGKNRLSRLDDI